MSLSDGKRDLSDFHASLFADVVVSRRKGSAVSLSFIDGAFTQASRGQGVLRQNLSSQSLARLEHDTMISVAVDQMSAASSDGGNTSPRTGRFSFFGKRGSARKPSVKAKAVVGFRS